MAEIVMWEVHPIPNRQDEDIFCAIITANDGKQLVAQCTSIESAEHIVSMHNDFVRTSAGGPKQEPA